MTVQKLSVFHTKQRHTDIQKLFALQFLDTYLFIDFGQRWSMCQEWFADSRMSIPGTEMEGIAPLVINDVGTSIIVQQSLNHFPVGRKMQAFPLNSFF